MAIYGLGAYYDSDVSGDFIARGVACVGWKEKAAPTLHHLLANIRVGDIIYLKSFDRKSGAITIKAVGIVTDAKISSHENLGKGVRVRWFPVDERIEPAGDKYNVRSNTLYEEWNPEIRERVVRMLLSEVEAER